MDFSVGYKQRLCRAAYCELPKFVLRLSIHFPLPVDCRAGLIVAIRTLYYPRRSNAWPP